MPAPNGMDIINGMRKRLTQKISDSLEKYEDIETAYDTLTGYMAVADALDIITDDEYQNASDTLYFYLTQQSDALVAFAPIEKHYAKDSGFQEALVVLKINIQERLNENLAKLRDPSLGMQEYSKEDILHANDLILTFGLEFNILNKKDYNKARDIMKSYANSKPTEDKIIFIPEAFYTKQ